MGFVISVSALLRSVSLVLFFPLIFIFAGWTVYHRTSESVTYKSSSKPRTRFLSGPVSLSICLYLFFSISPHSFPSRLYTSLLYRPTLLCSHRVTCIVVDLPLVLPAGCTWCWFATLPPSQPSLGPPASLSCRGQTIRLVFHSMLLLDSTLAKCLSKLLLGQI